MKNSLTQLPPEITWQIVNYLPIEVLAVARLVCKRLRTFCDHPSHWRHLQLQPTQLSDPSTCPSSPSSSASSTTMSLWQLRDLQELIAPHRRHIQSIQIWGVRDNIINYLLRRCPNLVDLTVCGWTTLSNYAFKLNTTDTLKLRRLKLLGSTQAANYAALDATHLSQLLAQCPQLTELMLGCQVHIHARTLIKLLKKAKPCRPLNLHSFTLATRRTWSQRHVAELLDLCPALQRVCLIPAAAKGIDLSPKNTLNMQQWTDGKPHVAVEPSSDNEDVEDFGQDLVSDMIIYRSGAPLP